MKHLLLSLATLFSLQITVYSQDTKYQDLFPGGKSVRLSSLVSEFELKSGNSKVAVPVPLPAEAKGAYYAVTILPASKKSSESGSLLSQLVSLEESGISTHLENYVELDKSNRRTSVYILQGVENAINMESSRCTKYLKYWNSPKSVVGYIENPGPEGFYIAVANNHEVKKTRAVIEVVALID